MLHLACLKAYDDIHAVIHCHAKFCTMFALTHQPIPCVIEEVEVFVGGDVPVANYKFTGSQELADEVSKWVGDRAAVLMANHGLLTVGKSPKDALKIANLVELTAEIMWGARLLGEIVPLPDSTRAEDGADLQDAPRHVATRQRQLGRLLTLRQRVRPSAIGSITASTRSSAATMSLNARIALVLSSSASALTTRPPHSTLSTRITPLGRSAGSSAS